MCQEVERRLWEDKHSLSASTYWFWKRPPWGRKLIIFYRENVVMARDAGENGSVTARFMAPVTRPEDKLFSGAVRRYLFVIRILINLIIITSVFLMISDACYRVSGADVAVLFNHIGTTAACGLRSAPGTGASAVTMVAKILKALQIEMTCLLHSRYWKVWIMRKWRVQRVGLKGRSTGTSAILAAVAGQGDTRDVKRVIANTKSCTLGL